jgi:hypothetical protein
MEMFANFNLDDMLLLLDEGIRNILPYDFPPLCVKAPVPFTQILHLAYAQ